MSDIIVTAADGTTDVTFRTSQLQGMQTIYTDTGSNLAEPRSLRIQHWLRPVGAKGTDRHEIAFQKAIVEDASNQFLVGSAVLKLSIPRSSEYTLALVKDLVAMLTSYINRTSTLTALFNGYHLEGDYNVTGPFNPSIA